MKLNAHKRISNWHCHLRKGSACARTLPVPNSDQFSELAWLKKNFEVRGKDNVQDKYLSTFSHQMEAFVFIVHLIVFVTRAVLKIEDYLTIRPVALSGYGSIAYEAKPNGLLARGP